MSQLTPAALDRVLGSEHGQRQTSPADETQQTQRVSTGANAVLSQAMQQASVGIARASHSMTKLAADVSQTVEKTRQVAAEAEEIRDAANHTQHDANDGVQAASHLSDDARHGQESLGKIAREMTDAAEMADQAQSAMSTLQSAIKAIESAAKAITYIAEQTRLLSLNASIEAARAGNAGRGFAVVANEVRNLSDSSRTAASQIAKTVLDVRNEAARSTQTIGAMSGEVKRSASAVGQVSGELSSVLHDAMAMRERVQAIDDSAAQSARAAQRIAQSGQASAGEMELFRDKLKSVASQIDDESERSFEIMIEAGVPCVHELYYQAALQLAKAVGERLEAALNRGEFGEAEFFAKKYREIPGTNPKKFTCYDAFTDREVAPLQEAFLSAHPEVVYAIAVNVDGYCPTHNAKFSRPPTGNYEKDLVLNRTKRIFDDPVGRRCGSHGRKVLVQTYRRDTGEVLHDLSVPLTVRGRHWGGIRIAYHSSTGR